MTTGCRSGGLSLYLRVCCVVSNLGQSVSMRGSGTYKHLHIICPKVRPKSCPAISDCKSLFEDGKNVSGVYTVNPDGAPFEVYCDMETDGGGWTVFQRRQDGSVYFYRNWTNYKNGFGNFTGEFWLGLSKIHRLTKEGSDTLRVDLEDFDGNTAYAKFSTFSIGDESTDYTLTAEGYSGTAGNSLFWHNGRRFSTYDNDNDLSSSNCAQRKSGAWWYWDCERANLNGLYYTTQVNSGKAITWQHWRGYNSLKFSEMKTRRNN
uniref:Fibrinogen C-terminal domain-containing protein n=1 Tax=Amphimedon queenslandica TaxID=400682 RepID=A0A1X7UM32_AMPQE